MSGLEFLQRIADGRLPQPPITQTLGFTLAEVAPGFALFTMTPQFKHYNPIAAVHGGVAATLLDSCMSCAMQTHLRGRHRLHDAGDQGELRARHHTETGPIRAEGRSLYVGRRSGTARARSSTPKARCWPTAPPPA